MTALRSRPAVDAGDQLAGASAGANGQREDRGRTAFLSPIPEAQPATAVARKSFRGPSPKAFRQGDDRKMFRHRLARALLIAMDRHRLGCRDLADICAVTPHAVRVWLREEAEPGGFALTQLNRAFGDEFRLIVAGVIPFPVKR